MISEKHSNHENRVPKNLFQYIFSTSTKSYTSYSTPLNGLLPGVGFAVRVAFLGYRVLEFEPLFSHWINTINTNRLLLFFSYSSAFMMEDCQNHLYPYGGGKIWFLCLLTLMFVCISFVRLFTSTSFFVRQSYIVYLYAFPSKCSQYIPKVVDFNVLEGDLLGLSTSPA